MDKSVHQVFPLRVGMLDRVLRLLLGPVLLLTGIALASMPFFPGAFEPPPGRSGAPFLAIALVIGVLTLMSGLGIGFGGSYLLAAVTRPRVEVTELELIVRHPVLFRRALRIPLNDVHGIRWRHDPSVSWFRDDVHLYVDAAHWLLTERHFDEVDGKTIGQVLNEMALISMPALSHTSTDRMNVLVLLRVPHQLPDSRLFVSAGKFLDMAKRPKGGQWVNGFAVRVARLDTVTRTLEKCEPLQASPVSLEILAPTLQDVRRTRSKILLGLGLAALWIVSIIGHVVNFFMN
jgi:hypothetical protein